MAFIRSIVGYIKKIFFLKKDFFLIAIPKSKSNFSASLTLVGVGPGDPDLLTIAAIRAIQESTLVSYPVSHPGAKSMASQIASYWLKGKKTLPLVFPMTSDSSALTKS